jgi:lipopolysaccharide assembly LptE-like protein
MSLFNSALAWHRASGWHRAFRWHRALALSLALLVSGFASGGCGYALAGHGSFLPDYVKIIGIPSFTNQTSYFDIAQILTDKVRTEFIGRGHFKVVPETPGADAVLVGTITGISILPTAFTSQQQASRYTITVTANIELRDSRESKPLWSNPAVIVRDEIDATGTAVSSQPGGAVDPAAFFNQETSAVQRVGDEFARTVVSAILEAF